MKISGYGLLGLLLVCLVCLGFAGCDNFDGGGQALTSSPVSGQSGLPGGDPASSALAALNEVSAAAVEEQDASGDVLLTRLSLVLDLDATLGQLSEAAARVGATGIAFSRPGSPFLDLIVPRQESVSQVNELAQRLDGVAGILLAYPAAQFQVVALPSADGATAPKDALQHLLPTRFPGAWNLRRLADTSPQKVQVMVADLFGRTNQNFDSQLEGSVTLPPSALGTTQHGFQVVGTLAAKFDALQSHGANPSPKMLDINLINFAGFSRNQGLDQLHKQIANRRDVNKPVIVNLSLGYNNQKSAEVLGNSEAQVRSRIFEHYLEGLHWAFLTHRSEFADKVLLIQAAGNDRGGSLVRDYPGLQSARLSSPFAIAAVIDKIETFASDPALWNPQPGILADLRLDSKNLQDLLKLRESLLPGFLGSDRNLALVGSTNNRERLESLSVSDFSGDGANLFAVGESVETITEPGAGLLDGIVDGTSFSAPQVAGLASYLWLLDDTLAGASVERTLQLIRATAVSNNNVNGIIDAYGAVMALDARRGDRRMRQELLDVDGPGGRPDSKFDQTDLQKFEREYGLATPGGAPDPLSRDYSRHDLNGDGFTGGTGQSAFDLDAAGLSPQGEPIFSNLDVNVEGETVTFDERRLSDFEVLKYFAYVTGPGGQPLFYDTSAPNALSERSRIFGSPILEVTTLTTPAQANSVAELVPRGCDEDGTFLFDEAPTGQSFPFTLRAGSTTLNAVRLSPTRYQLNFSTSVPQALDCPDSRNREHGSGAVITLRVVASRPGRLTTRLIHREFPPDVFVDNLRGPNDGILTNVREIQHRFGVRVNNENREAVTLTNFPVLILDFEPSP